MLERDVKLCAVQTSYTSHAPLQVGLLFITCFMNSARSFCACLSDDRTVVF